MTSQGRSRATVAAILAFATAAGCAVPRREDAGVDAARDAGFDRVRTDVAAGLDARPDVSIRVDATPYDTSGGADVVGFTDATPAADADAARCDALSEAYAAAVRDARGCGDSAACATLVCETLCCSCRVYVSAQPDRLRELEALADEWRARRCETQIACATSVCDPATGAVCTSDGVCATLRRTEN